MSSGTGPLSPDFTGIDPDLMQGFITALEHGRDVIGEQSERIRRLLAAAEVSAVGLRPLKEIEDWIDSTLPDLRKRNETIQMGDKLAPWMPGAGLVTYDEEKFLSPAEARKRGTELGERLLAIEPDGFFTTGSMSKEYTKVFQDLTANRNDADYTAAFFTALGLEETLKLPGRLREDLRLGAPTAPAAPINLEEDVLRIVSQAFGTAVTAGAHVPGFAKVRDGVQRSGSGAGKLLCAGRFPTDWLTDMAKRELAHPEKARAGLLYALGNNPAAARKTIAALAGPYTKDQAKLRTLLKGLYDYAGGKYLSGSDQKDAFGRMLAAASGAYDEKDGGHSAESAAFAFTVMTTFDDLRLFKELRPHLAEIAGAYATEITEGANIGDANMTEPSALKPSTSAFGTRSAFTLSPKDTYRFLRTFADSAESLAPFDEGMGRFSQKLIADASATTRRTGNTKHLDQVFTALGNVRGFELAAVEKVQGNLDMIDEQRDKTVTFIRDTGIGLASTFLAPTMPAGFAWLALSTTLSAEGAFGPEDETRMDRVNKQDDLETLGRQHTYDQLLMANGFTPKTTPADFQAACPPGVAVADGYGNLRPFSELVKQGNRGLEAFEKWTVANGMGKDALSVGDLSRQMAFRFDGANTHARQRGLSFDLHHSTDS